jgi:aminoglycoside 3-N-acetyltransferase
MTESDAIGKADKPATVESLVNDLRALGLEPGQVVLVHSSLSALGWVVGGAQAVVMALMDVITDAGTLVMPAHSTGNSDPRRWENPPVPYAWHEDVRAHMPAFDRNLTPTRGMGAVAELFRRAPDVRRSNHPALSFAAWGRYAHAITAEHRLNSGLGEDSPLARVYDFDGKVLLLGTGHDTNTSLHLSEHRATWSGRKVIKYGSAIMVGNQRQWVSYEDLEVNSDDFAEIGWDFIQTGLVRMGSTGAGRSQLMNQRELVDFGVQWINRKRK